MDAWNIPWAAYCLVVGILGILGTPTHTCHRFSFKGLKLLRHRVRPPGRNQCLGTAVAELMVKNHGISYGELWLIAVNNGWWWLMMAVNGWWWSSRSWLKMVGIAGWFWSILVNWQWIWMAMQWLMMVISSSGWWLVIGNILWWYIDV